MATEIRSALAARFPMWAQPAITYLTGQPTDGEVPLFRRSSATRIASASFTMVRLQRGADSARHVDPVSLRCPVDDAYGLGDRDRRRDPDDRQGRAAQSDPSRRLVRRWRLVTQFMTVALATSLVALAFEQPQHGFPTWSGSAMFGMIFMAVVATGLAFYLQTRFQRDISPDRVALIFTIEPVAAALFSYVLLGEVSTAPMAVGAALILAGVGAAEYYAARRELRRAG
jgi:uncharacterized membrane protein